MDVETVMKRTTYRQFRRWNKYFEQLWNIRTKEDHYMAHLITTVMRGWARFPKKVKVADQLLSFTFDGKGSQNPELMSDEEKAKYIKNRTENSQLVWRMILGTPQKPPGRDKVTRAKASVPVRAAPAQADPVLRKRHRK